MERTIQRSEPKIRFCRTVQTMASRTKKVESSSSMNKQKFTHVFNPALFGEQIGERSGELRILWNDGRSFWHARRFLVRSKFNESSSVEIGEAQSKFYMYDGPYVGFAESLSKIPKGHKYTGREYSRRPGEHGCTYLLLASEVEE
jgi:hypothetical protein